MRYAAIVILSVLGLVELVFRVLFVLAMVASVLGIFILIFVSVDNSLELIQPKLFEFVSRLVETQPVKVTNVLPESTMNFLKEAHGNGIVDLETYEQLVGEALKTR